MKVTYTKEAQNDLEDIIDYIAQHDVVAADKLLDRLSGACETLADAPRGYPLVMRYQHLGIRRRPFENYLIFYRIEKGKVEVVHVLHGARDYERLLFSEG